MRVEAGRNGQSGFTLIELAIATAVLLFGVVAVVQLVPQAIQSNLNNRYDTTATVTAQRLLDLMINQGINAATLVDTTNLFPCSVLIPCNLGQVAGVGGTDTVDPPVANYLLPGGQINFNAPLAGGYNFIFIDPNDPTGTRYDVRWAVITSVRNLGPNPNVVVAKRFVVGARRSSPTTPSSVTLSAWVSR